MPREIEYIHPNNLIIIGLDTDDESDHPLYDERVFLPVNENLVKNISVYGIQQPVLVRREGGEAYVVDGRQRVRAARVVAKGNANSGEYEVKVPVRDVEGSDGRVQGIMVSTNEQRTEDELLAKAKKAERLLATVGDMAEVAIAFGRSEATIKNWMTLLKADPRVHTAIRGGVLSASAAVAIAKAPRAEQATILATLSSQSDGAITERAAKDLIDGTSSTSATASSKSTSTRRASGKSHNQSGVKRTWLRKALATDAAKALTADQRAVLDWVANGTAQKGQWFDDFRWDVEAELEDKAAGKKSKSKPAPKVKAEPVAEPAVVVETASHTTLVEPEQDDGSEADAIDELAELTAGMDWFDDEDDNNEEAQDNA